MNAQASNTRSRVGQLLDNVNVGSRGVSFTGDKVAVKNKVFTTAEIKAQAREIVARAMDRGLIRLATPKEIEARLNRMN